MPNKNYFKNHQEWLNYYRNYREKNRLKFREYYKKYNKEWRKKNGYHNEEKWKENNREKVRAEKIIQKLLKMGKIIKLPCQICGDIKSMGHHPDYNKPKEVIWLCAIHHSAVHRC